MMPIIFVSHPQLVIAHRDSDQTTLVLHPPGLDPTCILDVASLVLSEQLYEELAEQLQHSRPWAVDGRGTVERAGDEPTTWPVEQPVSPSREDLPKAASFGYAGNRSGRGRVGDPLG